MEMIGERLHSLFRREFTNLRTSDMRSWKGRLVGLRGHRVETFSASSRYLRVSCFQETRCPCSPLGCPLVAFIPLRGMIRSFTPAAMDIAIGSWIYPWTVSSRDHAPCTPKTVRSIFKLSELPQWLLCYGRITVKGIPSGA